MLEIRKINPLNPFGRMCVSLGMIPSSYKESMTYEEQLIWLFNYLENTLIPKINEDGERVNELIDLFNQLKEYVDNYFENLDVQDEINHKLDEMVEDGTFDVIFAQVDEKIGDLSSLTTTDTSSIVSAVNEIDSNTDTNTSAIGDLSNLTTTSKTDLVSAVNEVDGDIGTLSSLTTDSKSNVVSAINEIDSHTDTNTSAIGTLSSLTTTAKNNLVASNNEIVSRSSTAISKLGVINDISYDSVNPTNNYTLESDVDWIQLGIKYIQILDCLVGTITLKNTFTLTSGSAKLLVTLNQPSGRTFQGGDYVGFLSNGDLCQVTVLGASSIKVYVKSGKSYSAGEITSIKLGRCPGFNTEYNVSF